MHLWIFIQRKQKRSQDTMSASHAHSASFAIVRLSWKQPECPWTGDAWTKVPLPPSLSHGNIIQP